MINKRLWIWTIFVVAISSTLIFVGCSSSQMDYADYEAADPGAGTGSSSSNRADFPYDIDPTPAEAPPMDYDMDGGYAGDYRDDKYLDDSYLIGHDGAADYDAIAQETGEAVSDEWPTENQRKIIREQYLEQQVQDLQGVLSSIEANISTIPGAYIENLREWKNETRNRTEHRAQMVLRIPVADFPPFLSTVEQQGNILDRHITGQDVTEEYYDLESRLRSAKKHEERILDLFDQAESIEEMLKIERELSRIQTNIEQMEGRQRYLQNVTSTVKLTLHLLEVEEEEFLTKQEETSSLEEAFLGLKKSVKDISYFAERFLVYLISHLPYLLFLLLILMLSIWFGRKILINKVPKKSEKENDAPAEKEHHDESDNNHSPIKDSDNEK